MPPRRKVYEEESEDEASEPQSEPAEDDELDMEVDEDGEGDEGDDVDVDVDGDGEHDDEAVVDDKDVVEEDIEDELIDDSDIGDSPPPEPRSSQPRLKIKLKLPTGGVHNTPPRARRQLAPRGSDIESEDEEDEDEEAEAGASSTRSTSVATAAGSRALTARQAVLANVVDSSHVSLSEPPNPRKKKPLTEIEIALKREETARKRRNLTEKKLEDEKAETINRLLKKQSRARGKRNALSTAEDRPGPGEAQVEGQEEEPIELAAPPPTMYRWVSSASLRTKQGTKGKHQKHQPDAAPERIMTLSFSVPTSVYPANEVTADAMAVDAVPVTTPRLPSAALPRCDVEGCTALRKYRLVHNFERGACGMNHLKYLEAH